MRIALRNKFITNAFLLCVILFSLVSPVFTQLRTTSVRVGQPYRIYPSSSNQIEPTIARHPTNPNILFASAYTYNPATSFTSEGVYVTTNGGASWRGNDTCTGAPITFHLGDPSVSIDNSGRFLLTRFGFPAGPGVYSHVSSNNGLSWSPQRAIFGESSDKATLTSDVSPSSPYVGISYAAWVRFAPPYAVYFSKTTDGGASWLAASAVNSPTQRNQGAEIAVARDGRILLCWARVINNSPYTEDFVGFATSSTGGATWVVSESAIDVNGIQGLYPAKNNILVNGLPKIETDRTGGSRSGWIYILTTQRNLTPAGSDPDLVLYRSTNAGSSWLPGVRVNQDALNNGKTQLFPAIHVDDNGGVNVLYYDDRSTSLDSLGVYISRSTDGGNTWTDYRINDKHFAPRPISGLAQGRMGDNIALTSVGNTLFPMWMDNTSGIYQVWTSTIDLTALEVVNRGDALSRSFRLSQNYPNPFNPSTIIEFDIDAPAFVSLRIFDAKGKLVGTLVQEKLGAGNYRKVFSAKDIASGIYFYELRSDNFVQTRKMLLLR